MSQSTGKFHTRRHTPQLVGTGTTWRVPTARCRATHDVPYTLRCVLPARHEGVEHQDKDGRTWL